jgi:hypothetical protein
MPESTTQNQQPGAGVSPRDSFEVHRQMVIALFIATLFLGFALAVGLCVSGLTVLMVVVVAGALGGFVSALRRLYAFQRVFPSDFFAGGYKVNLYLIIYSMIPPLVGAIAAATVYVIFASGLITGDMFPEFHLSTVNPRVDDFNNFVNNWQPVTPVDYAKAIVWAFIAGFSERFVPDMLERLSTKQADKGENK